MIEDQIFEEVTVKTEDLYSPISNGGFQQEPHLIITEQPAASVRFRYPSEGNSHGGIPGVQSKEFRKTCPTVEIVGYKGHARIVVQLVTDDPEPKLHVHSLVGKQCTNGICSVACGPGEMRSQFPNLGIQHVKRKDAEVIIQNRLAEQYQMKPKDLKDQAKADVEKMNLSHVCLMFIAYLPDENNEMSVMLPPVVSNVIMDNKSTLKICRISRVDSPATGGAEVYLLCDKVQKDEIQVRMFEVDASQNEIWEDYCRFSPTDVHRQYAIVMKTPAYRNTNIERPVNVFIQLRRRNDGQFSQPQKFTYTPVYDENDLQPTKRKRANCGVGNLNVSHMNALGGVTNTYRGAPFRKNAKPKVDHHNKPIDPSLLMKHFNQTPKTQPAAQRSPPYATMQTAMHQSNNVSQSMVMTSTQQYQNYQPTMSQVAVTTMSDINALSPQNMGSPIEDVLSVSSHAHGSPYSNPGSAGMPDLSQGSPLAINQMHSPMQQQMSPVQQVLSPVSTQQATVAVSSFNNVQTSLPCIPGMNIPKPSALASQLQQNQTLNTLSQGSNLQIYTSMQNVQANSGPNYGQMTFSQQETDRQAFGGDYESVLEQLDADNASGRVPSLGSQFVENLLFGTTPSLQKFVSTKALIQADCTVEKQDDGDETSEDFTCAMQESREEGYENPGAPTADTPTGDIFTQELLQGIAKTIARSLIEYRQSKKPEILAYVEQLFNKIHDRDGNTCLHLTALNSKSDLLIKLSKLSKIVKEDGSLLNVCNASYQTPLHLAILCKDISAVKSLIAAGANPKIGDGDGNTGIHLACSIGHPEMLNTVLTVVDCCDDLYNFEGSTPLHILINEESETSCECLQALLSHNLDIDAHELKSGQTALHVAVENSNITIAAHLIVECGADIDSVTFGGITPLHIAAAQGETDLVKLLLALGALKESEDFDCAVQSVAANNETRVLLNGYSADSSIVKAKLKNLFVSGHSLNKKDILDILDVDGRTEDLDMLMEKLNVAASTEVY